MAEKNTLNILQRMAQASAEIQSVGKNLFVETGQGKGYQAVGETDIVLAVKPIEEKHGIYSYPVNREIVDSDVIEKQNKYGVRTEYFMRMRTTYRFVNVDNPEDYIEVVSYSDGIDSGDKGCGKAMTYGDKYALMKAYKIPTGEDPDREASDTTAGTRKGASRGTKQSGTVGYTRDQLIDRINGMYTPEDVNGMLGRIGVGTLELCSDEVLRKMAKV